MSVRKLLFLLAALGSGAPALAQRTAVAPLVPLVPVAALPQRLLRGTVITPKPPSKLVGRLAVPVPDQSSRPVWPQPVFLINSRIIVGSGLVQINPQNVARIEVYKTSDGPAGWPGPNVNGIVAITLKPHSKPKIKTKSLAALGRGLKLRGPVRYQLEGLPLEDQALRIAPADIARLDTQPTASGTIVNIHLAVPPPVVHLPGTIMIRGASGY